MKATCIDMKRNGLYVKAYYIHFMGSFLYQSLLLIACVLEWIDSVRSCVGSLVALVVVMACLVDNAVDSYLAFNQILICIGNLSKMSEILVKRKKTIL